MPIFGYRCECGRTADVLVRNGREPATCDDIAELSGLCKAPGAVARQLSAPYVATSASSGQRSAPDPSCGHCGKIPGSCGSDN